MLKVCKFGGSSLSDAKHFKQVKAIIEADKDRKCVIVSAPGKGEGERDKITDLLYLCFQHNKYHVEFDSLFERVEQRYLTIKKELNIDYPIENDIKDIKDALKAGEMTEAKLVSRGEYLCAKLLSAYLGYSFLDAKDLIHFKFDGKVDEKKTNEDITKAFSKVEKAVIPGFYGSYPNGDICLFSRGGSDVSASYFAEALDAYLYENFTDVDNVYPVDPRIVPEVKEGIDTMTYREMRELAYAGFGVFNDEAIFPAVQARIPINVRNTNHPNEPGTMIVQSRRVIPGTVTGIAAADGFCNIIIDKYCMNREVGFTHKLLDILQDEHVAYEHLPSGIDSISVVIRGDKFSKPTENRVVARIKRELMPDSVMVTRGYAILMVVGEGMAFSAGMLAKATAALAEHGINISMVNQGASEFSFMLGIKGEDREKAVRALYKAYFG